MIAYNPNERVGIPKIGVSRISVIRVPYANVFGVTEREGYKVVDTDEPYLLWEDGTPMLWENRSKVKLEQQKMRKWQQAARR